MLTAKEAKQLSTAAYSIRVAEDLIRLESNFESIRDAAIKIGLSYCELPVHEGVVTDPLTTNTECSAQAAKEFSTLLVNNGYCVRTNTSPQSLFIAWGFAT